MPDRVKSDAQSEAERAKQSKINEDHYAKLRERLTEKVLSDRQKEELKRSDEDTNATRTSILHSDPSRSAAKRRRNK